MNNSYLWHIFTFGPFTGKNVSKHISVKTNAVHRVTKTKSIEHFLVSIKRSRILSFVTFCRQRTSFVLPDYSWIFTWDLVLDYLIEGEIHWLDWILVFHYNTPVSSPFPDFQQWNGIQNWLLCWYLLCYCKTLQNINRNIRLFMETLHNGEMIDRWGDFRTSCSKWIFGWKAKSWILDM